jgi:hypothetical protein
MRETGTGQQVAQLHDRYMMMMIYTAIDTTFTVHEFHFLLSKPCFNLMQNHRNWHYYALCFNLHMDKSYSKMGVYQTFFGAHLEINRIYYQGIFVSVVMVTVRRF